MGYQPNDSLSSLNANLKWKLLDSVIGSKQVPYPDHFEELLINVSYSIKGISYNYQTNIPKIAIPTGSDPIYYKVGHTAADPMTDMILIYIGVYKDYCIVPYGNLNGSLEITNSIKNDVYFR